MLWVLARIAPLEYRGVTVAQRSSLRSDRTRDGRASQKVAIGGRILAAIQDVLPGLCLCVAVTVAAETLQGLEARFLSRTWLESVVLAILLGAAIRTCWAPAARWRSGIEFSAKLLLEIAVVLLGASVSAATLLAAGPALLLGVAAVVSGVIAISYGLGRRLGLPRRMAMLVACGNSICGNSAIVAVAAVIGADGEDVAASIAFTAVLGVLVVLGLPLLAAFLHLTSLEFGALAGLTVYAVPQVLAATAPAGAVALQFGTLVKLVRVLMLGPVCLTLSWLGHGLREEPDEGLPQVAARERQRPDKLAIHELVPWFIIGFLVMVGARSAGAIPRVALAPLSGVAGGLTVVSMAALGLGTDVRAVARAGGRVALAVTLSLLLLGLISLGLVRLLHLA
jgi:uncharacterized integral membrane protein (TIGR00698 family)